jgi:hypothetical protein
LRRTASPRQTTSKCGFTCIGSFFNETKHVIIIDIDKPEDTEATVGTDAP